MLNKKREYKTKMELANRADKGNFASNEIVEVNLATVQSKTNGFCEMQSNLGYRYVSANGTKSVPTLQPEIYKMLVHIINNTDVTIKWLVSSIYLVKQ